MSDDERVQQMLDDPERYFAEARREARAMVDQDLLRRAQCRRERRRRGIRALWQRAVGHLGWLPYVSAVILAAATLVVLIGRF